MQQQPQWDTTPAGDPNFGAHPAGVDMSTESNNNNNAAAPAKEGGYKGKKPAVAFFHAIFKVLAVLLFFSEWIGIFEFVYTFIFCTLLLAADFWTVKNISGRLMVRLRWWNQVNLENGASEWKFEAAADAGSVDKFDSWFFWVVNYVNVLVWFIFLLLNLFKLRTPLILIALCLGGTNAYCYFKCSREQKSIMKNFVKDQAVNAAKKNPEMAMKAATATLR